MENEWSFKVQSDQAISLLKILQVELGLGPFPSPLTAYVNCLCWPLTPAHHSIPDCLFPVTVPFSLCLDGHFFREVFPAPHHLVRVPSAFLWNPDLFIFLHCLPIYNHTVLCIDIWSLVHPLVGKLLEDWYHISLSIVPMKKWLQDEHSKAALWQLSRKSWMQWVWWKCREGQNPWGRGRVRLELHLRERVCQFDRRVSFKIAIQNKGGDVNWCHFMDEMGARPRNFDFRILTLNFDSRKPVIVFEAEWWHLQISGMRNIY